MGVNVIVFPLYTCHSRLEYCFVVKKLLKNYIILHNEYSYKFDKLIVFIVVTFTHARYFFPINTFEMNVYLLLKYNRAGYYYLISFFNLEIKIKNLFLF